MGSVVNLTRLLSLPPRRQAMVIDSLNPVGRRRLLEETLGRMVDERRDDPQRVRELAEMAARIADRAGDIAAATRARLELANAQRRLGSHSEAGATLLMTEPILRAGGTQADITLFLSYRASLALEQGDWRSALTDLEMAKRSCSRMLSGALWTQMAMALEQQGDLRGAMSWSWQAVQLAEEMDLPLIMNCAGHNLARCLSDSGHPEAAGQLLDRLRPLNVLVGNEYDWVKAECTRAQALAGAGSLDAALDILRKLAISSFRDDRLSLQTGLHIALDAVAVARRRGHAAGARAILAEVLENARQRELPQPLRRLLVKARHDMPHDLPATLARLRTAAGGPFASRGEPWLHPRRGDHEVLGPTGGRISAVG